MDIKLYYKYLNLKQKVYFEKYYLYLIKIHFYVARYFITIWIVLYFYILINYHLGLFINYKFREFDIILIFYINNYYSN